MPTPTMNFTVFDGHEFVTYEPAGGSIVNNILAVRRPLTQSRQRNVERYIELQATDIVFHLNAQPLAGSSLSAGDTLTDSESSIYAVLFVERQTLNNTVAVVCRRLV